MSQVRVVLASLCVGGLTFGAVLLLRGNAPVAAPGSPETPVPRGEEATEWTWHYRQTPRQVGALVGSDERIVSIEIERASPLLLDVATVHNVGRLQKAWWWLPGPDGDLVGGEDLAGYAGRRSARIVSLAPYVVGGETRFAALLVANGNDGSGWWWYFDQSPDGVDAVLAKNEARPIDLRSYVKNGTRLYAVVMVPKRPGEKTWWYMNVPVDAVRSRLKENGAVLASLNTADPAAATFDVVMNAHGMTNMPDFQGVSWVWGTTETD
jgi:hypothetical protein